MTCSTAFLKQVKLVMMICLALYVRIYNYLFLTLKCANVVVYVLVRYHLHRLMWNMCVTELIWNDLETRIIFFLFARRLFEHVLCLCDWLNLVILSSYEFMSCCSRPIKGSFGLVEYLYKCSLRANNDEGNKIVPTYAQPIAASL